MPTTRKPIASLKLCLYRPKTAVEVRELAHYLLTIPWVKDFWPDDAKVLLMTLTTFGDKRLLP